MPRPLLMKNTGVVKGWPGLRLGAASLGGIVVFFLPITIEGAQTVVLDHIVTGVQWLLGPVVHVLIMAFLVAGALEPWLTGQWRQSRTDGILTVLKALGVVTGIMALTGWGPAFLQNEQMLPFLYDKLVIPVGLIVPIGSVFLVLLIGYGLMELLGVLMEPIMKSVWRTPGRSAVDAVTSFVGSYSLGLLITDRVYHDGYYSAREAGIIATGFSTVSVAFMLIVAKALDLMSAWNAYFWLALVITFAVTAITARLPPLSRLDNKRCHDDGHGIGGNGRLRTAWRAGLAAAAQAPPLHKGVYDNGRDGLLMAIRILPSILSVGLIGLLLAHYTPIFSILGWLFYPIAALWQVSQPLALTQSAASGLAEMFLPTLLLDDSADFVSRFSVAIVSVSSILFFSASIPCILSTRIPLSVPQLVVIWFERTALSLFLAIPAAYMVAWGIQG